MSKSGYNFQHLFYSSLTSNSRYLDHNGPLLVWNRDELLGGSVRKDFHGLLKRKFGFDQKSRPTPIEEVRSVVDEDEVTYALAHRVLLPNNFRIVSISYPGAQGGSAVLPEPTEGKRQKREYPDIIALPPLKASVRFDAMLSENKGMFKQSEVEGDVAKLKRYHSSAKHREALKGSLVKARVMDANYEMRDILIGVGFGVASPTPTTWRLDEIDFVFRIVERNRWAVGIFNQELHDLISKVEGDTNFPQTYTVSTTKTPAKKSRRTKADSALDLFTEKPDDES